MVFPFPTITLELFKSPVVTLVLELLPFELVPVDPELDPDPDIVIFRNGLINFQRNIPSTSQF